MRRFSLSLLSLCLLLVSVSFAQQTSTTAVPNLIRYDGTLKDVQSAAVSAATVGVIFAIYKQQDGGAPVSGAGQCATAADAGPAATDRADAAAAVAVRVAHRKEITMPETILRG